MAIRGWYPDPAGQPGLFRYWDGAAWTQDLTPDPSTPLPGDPAPPPAAAPPPAPVPAPPILEKPEPAAGWGSFDEPTRYPGAQEPSATAEGAQWTPMLPPAPPTRPTPSQAPPSQPTPTQTWPLAPAGVPPTPFGGAALPPTSTDPGTTVRGNAVVLALGAVLLVLAVGLATFVVVRAMLGDDDTDAATAPTTAAPTDPASTAPGGSPDPAVCLSGAPTFGSGGIRDGRILGGGLSTPLPDDYALAEAGVTLDQAAAFTFADAVTAPSKVIASTATSSWVATVALGDLSRVGAFGPGSGVTSVQLAAEQVFACAINSPMLYSSVSSIGPQTSQATTVDGAPAWSVTGEVRVDEPELGIEGDLLRVVVVDLGEDRPWGMFLSVAPLGDDAELATQQGLVDGLRVD